MSTQAPEKQEAWFAKEIRELKEELAKYKDEPQKEPQPEGVWVEDNASVGPNGLPVPATQRHMVTEGQYTEQFSLKDFVDWNESLEVLPGKMAGRAVGRMRAEGKLPPFDRSMKFTVTVRIDA